MKHPSLSLSLAAVLAGALMWTPIPATAQESSSTTTFSRYARHGADVWARDFNTALAAALPGLPGTTVFQFDAASLLDALIADPVGTGSPKVSRRSLFKAILNAVGRRASGRGSPG